MATGVVFGSPRSLLLQPGAYSMVDASALNFAPAFAYNVVCILGAALGGKPLEVYEFRDPIQAQQLFGFQTPLAEAIRFAFKGGVNGGAPVVLGVRIDNTAQSYGTLTDANSGTELLARFKDFGAYGNTYSVAFYPGSTAGTMAIVQGKYLDGRDYLQKFDNYTSFGQLISKINSESPLTIEMTAGGTKASQTITLATSQVDGRATVTDGQGVQRTTQAYAYQYPAVMAANTTDSMIVTYNGAITFAVESIDTGTEVWTTAAHTLVPGSYIRIAGDTLPPEVVSANPHLVYASASSTTLQVAAIAPAQTWAISAINAGSDLLTAPGNTLANGNVVYLDGTTLPTGTARKRNYFVVGKSGDDFQLATSAGGSPVDLSGAIAGCNVTLVATGALAISGSVSNASITLLPGFTAVSASNPAAFNGSREAAATLAAYTQAVVGVVINDAAYTSDSARWTLQGSETWGHVSGRGLPGTIFTIASGVYAGTYQILHYEFDGFSADKTRIVRKLSGDRTIQDGAYTGNLVFYPSFRFPRSQPPTEALESRLPANGLLATGGQYLSLVVGDSSAIYYATQIGDTIQNVGQAIAGLVNESAGAPVVASAAYNAGTYTSTITLVAKVPGIAANAFALNFLVNEQNTLLVAAGGTRLTGGIDPAPPRNAQGVTSGSIILSNGFDSAPTYQRWLQGLDVVRYVPARAFIPAGTADLGVQVAFADHVALMSSTPQRRERFTVLGHGKGWTPAAVRERAELFQSERVVFVSPSKGAFRHPDALTGAMRDYDPYYAAAVVAGAIAAEGNGISDPITHTYLRDFILTDTYQPGSAELDQMIDSGVLTWERDPALVRSSRGYRITRGITTWRITTQSAFKSNIFESITVVQQSDFIAADIREMEEALFIGTSIFADTLEQIRTAINRQLQRRVAERVIYGYDPAFTQVTLNRDSPRAVDAVYKIYPSPDLDFILNTQLLFPIPTEQ